MTKREIKATLLGMYSKKYNSFDEMENNNCHITEYILVCILEFGKIVTINLLTNTDEHRYHCMYDYTNIQDKHNDITKEITYFPKRKYEFDLETINETINSFMNIFDIFIDKDFFKKMLPLEKIKNLISTDFFLHNLALCGQLDLLKWFHINGYPLKDESNNLFSGSALGGHLDLFKWLFSINLPCPYLIFICSDTIKGGNLELLKYLIEKGIVQSNKCDCFYYAAIYGQLEMLKLLHNIGCKLDEFGYTNYCLKDTAKNGHVEVLKWLCNNGFELNNNMVEDAVIGGQLEVVKFLFEKGCSLTHDDMSNLFREDMHSIASRYGHIEVLKWLEDHNFPLVEISNVNIFLINDYII